MCKKLFCGLMSVLLLLTMVMSVSAEETEDVPDLTLTNLEEFLEFAENCRLDTFSMNLTVSLEADLDLGNTEFAGIPIFGGTFRGNGHIIRGLTLNEEGSYQGLFRYLTETAVVDDLHLEGLLLPKGTASKTGALAGSNAGVIRNCSFSGTVSGSEQIGGLVGVNNVGGLIENCTVSGFISGSHFVGGIAGRNSGVIRGCKNDARVNTTAQQNRVELSDITLESLTSSESSNTVTDIGGIAGHSTGVIRGCINRGDVGYRHMGYNIGGIVGTQSGYVVDCVNYGEIMGRKEIGGIVGQMEPTTMIRYEEDALQILERQLNSLGGIVSETAGNVQAGAYGMYIQVDALRNSVYDAEDAVKSLIPEEGEELPDLDTIQAAKNTLSSSMASMSDTLRGMSAVTESMVGALSNNLHAIESQINAMRVTLGNADETLGGSVEDVSDEDTVHDLTGKAESCVNYGAVLADLNAGGITGAMAVENDLDHKEDISVSGGNSLNFSSQLRCVVRNCRNEAVVTAGKQNVGGIVGWQSMGLVKDCTNAGQLDAAAAQYVGGISGRSDGYIRACGAKCAISGNAWVGGIAGSAVIATDCVSMVQIDEALECVGAVLGNRTEGFQEEENPVSGNRYLIIGEDMGAIDGISYGTVAEPISLEAMLTSETVPEMFRRVTVTFRYANGGESRFALVPGDAFPEEKIPAVPQKAGFTGRWSGLEAADLTNVLFDLTFEAEYTAFENVLSSGGEEEKPLLLIQGGFGPGAVLEVTDWAGEVPLEEKQTLVKAKSFAVTDNENLTGLRFCVYDWDPEENFLLIRNKDGVWYRPETTADGSYLVAALQEGDNAVAQIREEKVPWAIPAAVGAVLACAVLFLIRKRKK